MTYETIPRESTATSKGFILQKLRATSLLLSNYKDNPSINILAAVEYGGDIYLDNGNIYIEENKAYESKDFSFASNEVKNTIVYFLDYWLKNNRDSSIRFGFYTTNKIAREVNGGMVKDLGISLPNGKIIELLKNKEFDTPDLLSAVKALSLHEYHEQYKLNKNYLLDKSYYSTIQTFTDDEWITFLNLIDWKFEQDNIAALEQTVIEQIKNISFPGINIDGKERFIRAELFYTLELRQMKTNPAERFITEDDIELTFRRAASGSLEEGSYKYLSLDYEELRKKTKENLEHFISQKYYSITGNSHQPILLERKVALFDPNVKLKNKQTESVERPRDVAVEGLVKAFVNSEKPVFLFGELGSGKSTIIANYLINIIDSDSEIIPIFIPSSYLQDKEFDDVEKLFSIINRYVNNELLLDKQYFDFNTLFKTNKEVILIIDGVDELLLNRSRKLIIELNRLKNRYSQLRVIATGRPLELEGVVSRDWHSLVTLPLKDDEIRAIFYQEGISNGFTAVEASSDAEKRFELLKTRNELKAVATTPLVICSIWPDLNESLKEKSLGDIIYDVVVRRLNWHESDSKKLEFTTFLEHFPNILQRESLLATIASEIFYSASKSIAAVQIINIIGQQVAESAVKNKIVHEASAFFKHIFLQKTTNDKFGFVSGPLLECASAIKIASELADSTVPLKDYFKDWRTLSFAMAINRRKSQTEAVRHKVLSIMNENLRWPNLNVAPIAIIIAELRNPELSGQLIHLLKTMKFRPLRVMEKKDALTLHAIAYCIMQSGDNGFNWFFDEYLNGKTALIHYESEMAADILGYYLIIHDFSIPSSPHQRLNHILQPNIDFATSLCFQLLPTVALIADNTLPVGQRCLLLADLLKDELLCAQSEKILEQLALTNEADVLTALETVAQKTEFSVNSTPALLWLKLNKSRPLSKSILENVLGGATKESCGLILTVLSAHLKKEDILAYLRFSIISQNKLSAQAALILFWNNERDFELLCDALVSSIDWLSQQYGEVNNIAAFISEKQDKAAEALLRHLPLTNHLGIPPAYWRILLDSLLASEKLFLPGFLHAVENLRMFVLTRYPDIRIKLTSLLTNKPEYRSYVDRATKGLDTGLRNNANAILLTCFPESESNAIIKMASGFFKYHSSSEEWQSFCLSLNYGKDTLDKLYGAIGKFVEGAKTFALVLLYHHNYVLNEEDIQEMVHGLLGPGYLFDRPGIHFSESPKGILSQPEFFSRIADYLNGADYNRAERASWVLLDYHDSRLTNEQKAICWSIRIDDFEQSFFEFSLLPENIAGNDDFTNAVIQYAEKTGKETLLYLFYTAGQNAESWKKLFLRFIAKAEHLDHYLLAQLHQWLVSYTRKFEIKRNVIAGVINELLLVPAYKENKFDQRVYLFLTLIADEFNLTDKNEIQKLIHPAHHYLNEELMLSLALRSGFVIPKGFINPYSVNYITLFSNYKPSFIQKIPEAELERFLIDSENLPTGLLSRFEEVLLYGQLNVEELNIINNKSTLGAYFAMIVSYCRNEKVDIPKLLKIRELGGLRGEQESETMLHRGIVGKFYKLLLISDENRAVYYNHLRGEMKKVESLHFGEYFTELLAADQKPEFFHFERLLAELLDRPYSLNENLAYYLSQFFAQDIPQEDLNKYHPSIENFLNAIINYFEKEEKPEYNLTLWLFSLVLLKIGNEITDTSRDAFLLGLRYVFLERNDIQRFAHQPPQVFFRAGDLFHYTSGLLSKIRPHLIKEIITYGEQSNIPEINSCCKILGALSGRNEIL